MNELEGSAHFIVPIVARGTLKKKNFVDGKWEFMYKGRPQKAETNILQFQALTLRELLQTLNEHDFKELTIQMNRQDDEY